MRQIRDGGASGFYAGPVAQAIVASSQAGKGLITAADLEQYQARERTPVECDYRGLHIVSAPPPSSGGTILCEMLNILEGYPLRDWGFLALVVGVLVAIAILPILGLISLIQWVISSLQ